MHPLIKKGIVQKIRYEFNYTNAERAAIALHAEGITSEVVNGLLSLSDTQRIQTVNALRDIELKIKKG